MQRIGFRRLLLVTIWTLPMMATEHADAKTSIRIATYNASLYGRAPGEIRARLADGVDDQAERVAAIVQTIRPDVLLINEIDYDRDGATARLLAENFIAKPQGGREPILYPFVYAVESNTGVDSNMDLNKNGTLREPTDAWGYGEYVGQYSMAVYSRYPIRDSEVRSFRSFLWKDLPRALCPIDPTTETPYYSDETWSKLRLSSKNHVDIPISIEGLTLHILACHPTPPVFDGDEDRNGCRNHDEIRFWTDYLAGSSSQHLRDDQGRCGGLPAGESFVIAGDLNSDPILGDSRQAAIRDLLGDERVQDPTPLSSGNGEKTAEFGSDSKLRVDYVLPSRTLAVCRSGVFWPETTDRDHDLISASDHRLVWVEVERP